MRTPRRRWLCVLAASIPISCFEIGNLFVQTAPLQLHAHRFVQPRSGNNKRVGLRRTGATALGARKEDDQLTAKFFQYVAFQGWRTIFFVNLLLLGSWSSRNFEPFSGIVIFLLHPNIFITFVFQAIRIYAQDWQRIADGVHDVPFDANVEKVCLWTQPTKIFRYFRSTRETVDRALRGGRKEMPDRYHPGPDGKYPEYYMQNFHWQTDGWLSTRSADAYEMQSEAFFGGAQDAMLRLCLVPIRDWLKRRREGQVANLINVGCGTGRLLCQLSHTFPRLKYTAADLSPYCLEACQMNWNSLASAASLRGAPLEIVHACAEDLPLEDESQDVIISAYLFNSLPPEERRKAAKEFYRVLKPGGLCVLADSVQRGDLVTDVLVELFARASHEPYYKSYLDEDLDLLFSFCGFKPYNDLDISHVTKVFAWTKLGGMRPLRDKELNEVSDSVFDGVPSLG